MNNVVPISAAAAIVEGPPGEAEVGAVARDVDRLANTISGVSLVPLLDNPGADVATDRVVYAMHESPEDKCVIARSASFKATLCRNAPTPIVFDLDRDPGELNNIAERSPDAWDRLRSAIQERESRLTRDSNPHEDGKREDREEALRAIGYIE